MLNNLCTSLRSLACATIFLVGASAAEAQLLRPSPAEVTPLLAADGVRAGGEVRAAIRVRLAEGLHVNSNKPRDPSLIPIVLTVDGTRPPFRAVFVR